MRKKIERLATFDYSPWWGFLAISNIVEKVNELVDAHNNDGVVYRSIYGEFTFAPFYPTALTGLTQPATDAQFRAIRAIARSHGMTPQVLEQFVKDGLDVKVEELTIEGASYIIKELQRLGLY